MAKREIWTKEVARWRRSGLTSLEYAAKRGLKSGTLLWWSSRLGREARSSKMEFVEVVTTASESPAEPIDVLLVNGRVVRVRESFDEETLARVLSVVERP